MALVFLDSMDLYGATADIALRWTGNFGSVYSGTAGRYGGKAISVGGTNSLRTVLPVPDLGSSSKKLFASFAVKWSALVAVQVFRFADTEVNISTTTAITSSHIAVGIAADGKITLHRGATLIATSAAAVIVPAQFHRVEIGEIYIHATEGTVKVRVDGVEVIDFTGNTLVGTVASVGAFGIYTQNTYTAILDDIMVWSGEGATPNTWVGDFRIDTLTPNAAGSTVQGTPVGVASAHLAIDEVGTPNNDTDYVVDAAGSTNTNLFGMSDLPGTPGTVIAAAATIVGRGDGTTTKQLKVGVKSGAATAWSDDAVTLPAQLSYVHRTAPLPSVDPATSAAWTPAAINAMEAGWKVTA